MPQRVPRKVFYSLLIVLLWLGFLTEGSHALLTDSATIAANSLTTGSAGLMVSTSQDLTSPLFAQSRPGFTLNGIPGKSDSRYVSLRNDSPASVPLDIDLFSNIQSGANNIYSATVLGFTPVDVTGTSTGQPISATLASSSGGHIKLNVTIPPQGIQRFRMDTTVDQAYGLSGQNATYDLIFTGTQHYVP